MKIVPAVVMACFGSCGPVAAIDCEALKATVDRYIYRVTVLNQNGVPEAQTGFRIANREGIFTALHGVVGATDIAAGRAAKGEEELRGLRVIKADRGADIAQLGLDDPRLAAGPGLPEAASVDFKTEHCLIGFPYDRPAFDTRRVEIGGALMPLNNLVGFTPGMTAFRSFLREAESPSLTFEMLDIVGAIVRGHSGAPLIDAKGHVFAMADGSLAEGGTDFSWATPLQRTCFSGRYSCSTEIRPLKEIEKQILDARNKHKDALRAAGLTDIITQRIPLGPGAKIVKRENAGTIGVHRVVTTKVTVEACDRARMETTVENGDFLFGFCLEPSVRFVGLGPLQKRQEVSGKIDRFCTVSQFEIEAALTGRALLREEPELVDLLGLSPKDVATLDNYQTAETHQTRTLDVPLPPGFCEPPTGSTAPQSVPGLYEVDIAHTVVQKPAGLQDTLKRVASLLRKAARVHTKVKEICPGLRELLQVFGEPLAC